MAVRTHRPTTFMRRMKTVLVAFVGLALVSFANANAQGRGSGGNAQGALPSIEEKTAGMQQIDGFLPMYWDADLGTLWMEIDKFDTEILHITGIGAGLGSNDIGINRGQLQGSRIVEFQKVGRKILMAQPNYRFRASSQNPAERRAVRDAFARSVLWGFTAAAQTDARVPVDLTNFVIRDATNLGQRLRPGTYRLDATRSSVYMPMTMGFPQNTEIEAELTFVRQPGGGGGGFGGFFGGGAGNFEGVSRVASTGEAASVRLHHSFVQLPDDNYTPRKYDPRSGYGAVTYADYSTPLGEPMVRRFIRRHRLEKVDPNAAVSDAVEPIVYYLDPGTPEPVRSALLDGARWWNQAFEAAGYRNAFQVELLPEGVSSLDVRYNVINWVHRSTRGWSTGGSVTDPRTGEIIKGVVTLGSLRIRQDYMIAEGLLSPYENGDETPPELAEWALARIRQLSAHEVGHTIGLGHNYYDSRLGRISVLDYPHPLITLNSNGEFDYSEVYDVDIGEWDKTAVIYGYQDFPSGVNHDEALQNILDEAWDQDIRYMSNQDVSAHPRVDQWSNGTDAAAELNRMMEVRRVALDRFGENAIKRGMPLATMEEVLVPLYMHHRYQVEAAASVLGGQDYVYAMRGDGREPFKRVSGNQQRAALQALMATIRPDNLVIPDRVLDRLPPRPSGYGRTRELFPRNTGSTFDVITPATVAAAHTVSNVLNAQRAARLVEQNALDSSLPGLDEILDALIESSFDAPTTNGYQAEVKRAVQRVVVDRMMNLASNAGMAQVRAVATMKLAHQAEKLNGWTHETDDANGAHFALLAQDIQRFMTRPAEVFEAIATPNAPPGAPIGDPGMDWLGTLHPACNWIDVNW